MNLPPLIHPVVCNLLESTTFANLDDVAYFTCGRENIHIPKLAYGGMVC